ncbi:MAG: hypothetical protein ACMUIL_11985 [bacterium]
MGTRVKTKSVAALILLGIVDAAIPVPVIGILLIIVIYTRPPWFRKVVAEIYRGSG